MPQEKLLTIIDHLEDELIAVRRHLHQFPELSNQEVKTTALLKQRLLDVGIHVLDVPLKTGLIAEVSGNPEGPVIAIRADIDALPIHEETDLPYISSKSEIMHACGHDFHTSVILGAAYLLKQQEHSLPGTVRIIFQPAEETGHGAEEILGSGGLDGVQAIFGLHNTPYLKVGEFGTRVGPLTAAVDRFEVFVSGKGTHAAAPDKGIDPIVASSHLITALQTIISRNTDPLDHALISITELTSGNTWNVIPEKAYLQGTVRTLNDETRKAIPKRMKQVLEGVGNGLGVNIEFRWHPGPPATNNDALWTPFVTDIANETGYEVKAIGPSLGGEDFAYYQKTIPGTFVNIGTGKSYNHHHPKFTIDEEAIVPAAQFFSLLASKALLQDQIFTSIKEKNNALLTQQ